MRWTLLLLITVGSALSAPPTIFDQAGLPDPFEVPNIEVTGTATVDSIYVRGQHIAVHLLMDSAFTSVDSVDVNHLVVNTTMDLLTDLLTVGSGTVGDVDFEINWDSGGATVLSLSINYGTGRWQTNNLGLFVDGLLTTNTTLRIGSIFESSGTDMYIDPETSGVGVLHLGLNENDTTRIDGNDYLDVDGTANFDGATQVDALSFDVLFATDASYDSTATLGALVYFAILDQTAGQDTLNLPAAASHTERMIVIKCVNANGSIVDANSTELIDADQTVALAQWDSISLFCDGTRWLIF